MGWRSDKSLFSPWWTCAARGRPRREAKPVFDDFCSVGMLVTSSLKIVAKRDRFRSVGGPSSAANRRRCPGRLLPCERSPFANVSAPSCARGAPGARRRRRSRSSCSSVPEAVNIRVAATAAPRFVSADYPRRGRGGACVSADYLRRGRGGARVFTEYPRRGGGVARVLTEYPRRSRGGAATRLHGISTSAAAVAPRLFSADYPRPVRGGAAIRGRTIRAANVRFSLACTGRSCRGAPGSGRAP